MGVDASPVPLLIWRDGATPETAKRGMCCTRWGSWVPVPYPSTLLLLNQAAVGKERSVSAVKISLLKEDQMEEIVEDE